MTEAIRILDRRIGEGRARRELAEEWAEAAEHRRRDDERNAENRARALLDKHSIIGRAR